MDAADSDIVDLMDKAIMDRTADNLSEKLDVWVLTHPSKQAITVETLGTLGVPFTVYENPDWEFPAHHPELQTDRYRRPQVRDYALRQYRAFRGHQEIARQADPNKYTLIFEDDMSLPRDRSYRGPRSIFRQLNNLPHLAELLGYDAVSFHGRKLSPAQTRLSLFGKTYVDLLPQEITSAAQLYFLAPALQHWHYTEPVLKWHEGALAYLLLPAGRTKWLDAGHGGGMPCDLFLVNCLNCLVLQNSLFIHDERGGSLIGNRKRA